jgi:hypothetical protein
MYVRGERICLAETGKAPAVRTLGRIQRSTAYDAAGDAGEDCAQSEAAARGASRPGTSFPTELGRQAGAGAIRDLPPRCGL